jgi:GNAT superfamily N-acetyltransferase
MCAPKPGVAHRRMGSHYYFTQAELGISQGVITGLWAQGLEGLVDDVAAAKYREYYVENPAGHGICLLLHDGVSGEAIGVQGLIPRTFYDGERRIDGVTLADFVVAPGHRSLGPALKLMRTCIALTKERFAFAYGTPNEKSGAILKRAGLRAFGNLTRYTKVLRSESFWRTRLPRWIVPLVAIAVDAMLACADIGRGWLYGRHWQWSEQTGFGPELEEIWQGRGVQVMAGERTPSILHWRYSSSDPASPWRISLATDPSNAPLAYVIWRQRNGIAMVSDFFCCDAVRSSRALLQSFIGHVRQFPVHRVSLEFFGHASVVAALAACGFVARGQSPILFIENTRDEMHSGRLSPNAVFMTSFDRDHED